MKQKVILEIDNTGKTTVLTVQNAGTTCQATADSILKGLGKIDDKSRENTDDYYKPIEGSSDISVST